MENVIDDIAERSGLERETAALATTLVADFLVTNLTAFRVADLKKHIPELEDLAEAGHANAALIASGQIATGSRGLGAALAGSFGTMAGGAGKGPAAAVFKLIGQLGKIGMSPGDMQSFARAMEDHMRDRSGSSFVDDMIDRAKARVPVIGRYLS